MLPPEEPSTQDALPPRSKPSNKGAGDLPLPAERQVNAACEPFEQAWKAGQRPRIEDYLGDTPQSERSALLRELIALDIYYRRQAGEDPQPEEYRARFPELDLPTEAPTQSHPAPQQGGPKPPAHWPQLPGYEIQAFIDGGGQGDVYCARQVRLDRLVALKVLRDSAVGDRELLARFHREGRLSARLDHPNIVRLYHHDEHDGRLYFTMEFVEGGSLKDRLASARRLAPAEAADLVATLAAAVQHAHDQGVVHRDLKPGNVLFTRSGTPKIADFGLAKRLGGDASDLTDTRAILGTAGYMAPEQATGQSKHATEATDVYGLGAILYRTVTGQAPFTGEDWLEVLIQVRTQPPLPPAHWRPDLPAVLEQICLKCLEKNPERRYPSAGALAADLRRYLAGELSSPPEGAPPSPSDAQVLGEATVPLTVSTLTPIGSLGVRWDGSGLPLIPGYEVLEEIGRGGMGVVYRARQLSLNRIVALKTIRGEVSQPEWQRLRIEAEAVAVLQHPHIVQVYDLGEHAGIVFIAMEYVAGGSLHRLLRGEPQPARPAAALVGQVAQAAGFAHQRGIVHLDIKPANVLLASPAGPEKQGGPRKTPQYGFPKLSDFGLVRRIGKDDGETEGMIMGTPSYMAPEQASGRMEAFSPSTDVWGLGALLYEMLTGRPPFRAASPMEVLMLVIKGQVVPPGKLQKVPRDLEAICLKCLQPDRARRYADGEALADDLRRFQEGRRVAARPGGVWSWLGLGRKN
jgi:serine/threonine protein kinase